MGNILSSNSSLLPNQSLTSSNGRYHLDYQDDGNLVLYDPDRPIWAAGLDGNNPGRCMMRISGRLVVRDANDHELWSKPDNPAPGSRLVLQDDGNLVIIRPDDVPVWASETHLPLGPQASGNTMQEGEVLFPETSLRSNNRRYELKYQSDGNLVLYGPGGGIWSSFTDGDMTGVCILKELGELAIWKPGEELWRSPRRQSQSEKRPTHLIVQDDGNVVVYDDSNKWVWDTNTALPVGPIARGDVFQSGEMIYPGGSLTSKNLIYRLTYQSDGNLVLYKDRRTPVWHTKTAGRSAGACVMQKDGNFRVRGPGDDRYGPITWWETKTQGLAGSQLRLLNDGKLEMSLPDGKVVWTGGDQFGRHGHPFG